MSYRPGVVPFCSLAWGGAPSQEVWRFAARRWIGRQEHRTQPMLLSISRHRPSAQGAPLVGIEVWRVWPQVMTCLFRRFRCTCPISHLHSPRFHKPPYDPGRSVLPSPVLVSAWCAICWIMVFPSGRRLKHWFTYTPRFHGSPISSSQEATHALTQLCVWTYVADLEPPSTQSPFALPGSYPWQG